MKEKISIIIPFLNESDNINNLVQELNIYFSKQSNFNGEVIFVDDGSKDNSVELLEKSEHTYYEAKIIKLSKNFGSHDALRAGVFHASGNVITFMYADLQDPLYLIDQLFDECKKGNEIAWAVRNSTEAGVFEKKLSQSYGALMRKYAISTYPENGFDIVMFSRKVQKIINVNIESNSSLFLQILTLGFKQSEIKYNKQSRKAGKSKWTLRKKIKLFIDSFVAFSYAPIRLVTMVGFLLFIFGIIWSSYILGRRLLFNDLATGWPALVSILMLGFGITNISLGIIAEYLWRTLDSSRKRPVFIIDEIIDINKDVTI